MNEEQPRGDRGRAARAFAALDAETGEFTRRRVWRRVSEGIQVDQSKRRRRMRWYAGIAASAAAALAIALPPAIGAAQSWYEPSQADQQRVAVAAAMQMFGVQPSETDPAQQDESQGSSMEQLVGYLVSEAEPVAE